MLGNKNNILMEMIHYSKFFMFISNEPIEKLLPLRFR